MNEKDIITEILNIDSDDIESWIKQRIDLLESTATEDREDITSFSYTLRRARGEKENTEVQGYIPSKTRLKKMQHDMASVRIDDTSFYKTVIDYIRQAKPESIIKEGKIRHNNIMEIIQCTIINYFGLKGSESRRNALYNTKGDIEDEPLSISDFKKNGAAMCVEKSAVAQNILTFLGYNPMMIFGYMSTDKGVTNEGHAYNCIIRGPKAMLIDFTNPIYKDGKYYRPSMFPIDSDTLEKFKKGKAQIEVTHNNLRTKDGKVEKEPIQVVYSSEEIDGKYFEKKKAQEQTEQTAITEPKSRLTIGDVRDAITQGKVQDSEYKKQTKDNDDLLKIKRLMFMQKSGSVLTDEEKALIEEHIRQTNQMQVRYNQQEDKNQNEGMEH